MNSLEIMKVLPAEIQEYVRRNLKAYSEITVTFEDGQYQFGTCIKRHYAKDHKVLGTIYAKDIYTEVERMENYINIFWDYPSEYKGKRDYSITRKMQDERIFKHMGKVTEITQYIGKINKDGDFEITGTETVTV